MGRTGLVVGKPFLCDAARACLAASAAALARCCISSRPPADLCRVTPGEENVDPPVELVSPTSVAGPDSAGLAAGLGNPDLGAGDDTVDGTSVLLAGSAAGPVDGAVEVVDADDPPDNSFTNLE